MLLNKSLSVALSVAFLLIASTTPSRALYPGACGKAGAYASETPTAGDALAVLRGSVGTDDCVPHICDVIGGGNGVYADDALAVLRVAVGSLSYASLSCPGCTSSVCTCTATDLINRLNDLGSKQPGQGQKLSPGVGVLFDCGSATTISVNDTNGAGSSDSWDDADTVIEQNNIWISQITPAGVNVVLSPYCDRRCMGTCGCTTNAQCATGKSCSSGICTCSANADCDGSTCNTGTGLCVVEDCTQDEDCGTQFLCKGTGARANVPDPVACLDPCTSNADCTAGGTCSSGACSNQCSSVGTNKCSSGHYRGDGTQYAPSLTQCPNIDNGQRFLKLTGSNITVAGLSVRGFFEGVHFAGQNDSFIDGELTRQCDDAITNEAGLGIGSLVKNTYIAEACDKGVQDYAGPAIPEGCTGNGCWHITYEDDVFEGCKLAVRVTGDDTHIRLKNTTIHSLGTTNADTNFWCQQSKFDGKDVVSSIENSTLKHCESGFVFGGEASQHDVLDSLILGNTDRGLDARGTGAGAAIGATVSVLRSRIVANGGDSGSAPLGGHTISSEGLMMIGDGTDANANKICGNVKGDGTTKEVNDIRTSGSTIMAEQNYWGQSGGPVSGDITGNVDSAPWRSTDPFSGTQCTY